jgi:hypothetical protein
MTKPTGSLDSAWRPIPQLQTPDHTLPADWPDGYWMETIPGKNGAPDTYRVHILTRHLTDFMMMKTNSAPLQLHVNAAKRLSIARTAITVRLFVAPYRAIVTYTLRDKRGRPVAAWKQRVSRTGVSYPRLPLAPHLRRPGQYSLTVSASAWKQTQTRRVLITFFKKRKPLIKITKKPIGVGVVGTNTTVPTSKRYRPEMVPVDQVFDWASSPAKNGYVLVLNIDVVGIDLTRLLHQVYPSMKIIALTSSPDQVKQVHKIWKQIIAVPKNADGSVNPKVIALAIQAVGRLRY